MLEIKLFDIQAGFLAGYRDGRNIFTFSHDYINIDENSRPVFSLKYYNQSENAFTRQLTSSQKLHPIFSNLLPEGELREYIVRNLKIHSDHEFMMLSHLGRDLPGALIATELTADRIPPYALQGRTRIEPIVISDNDSENNKFSLSGVLMKFSMVEENKKFFISKAKNIGKWIVKIPSTRFRHIPLNEYSSMKLAFAAGINIPTIGLVKLSDINGIPDIKMPDEKYAYTIKRFDRDKNKRVHAEDFAQIYEVFSIDKYQSTNYDTIARTIYQLFPDAILDIQEFIARLVVNIMIGNGDAHLKNLSVIYPDRKNPALAPAYDILFTRAYTVHDDSIALNLGKEKKTAKLTLDHFKTLARKADIDWQIIKRRIYVTIDRARTTWPALLKELPMADSQKKLLRQYWKSLTNDFRID
ncbi:MAG: HipA domain-containing protein, partial [Thermodesulfobacteriota bacterium]|nr:HipA domain-containing protein [Thermodesulfobacteriota bacterium]